MTTKNKRHTKPSVVSFRCPAALMLRLDGYVAQLKATAPGGNWTRSSAAMNLVVKGLKEASIEPNGKEVEV